MARKRKADSRAAGPSKKQQQQEQVVEEPKPESDPDEEVNEEEEEVEVEYEEVEEKEEEEEEEDDDDEEGEGDDDQENHVNRTAEASASGGIDDDDDEEPIQNLLEPFSKDQLVNLLREAADKHRDVADRIQMIANEDPAHRKIFVHGLGWDTTAEILMGVFKQYGEIEDCKAVCDKVSGKSKGYGFVLFKTRAGARKALKEPQKEIGNRMAGCQLASVGPVPAGSAAGPSVAKAGPVQHPVSEYTQRKIYVSNVGADLDPQKLYAFFAKFGEIEEGPLGLDKVTKKPKGFCLFVYKVPEGARKALEEPHKNFEGHILHCQKAIDGPKPGKHHQHQQHHQHRHNSHNAQYQRNDNTSFAGGAAAGPGHLMAPPGPGIGFNQGPAAAQALNPALGQALTTLLATQGAGLGLTNLLGSLGTTAGMTPGMPGAGHGMQGAYGNQASISPGMIGGYGNQGGVQAGYTNQQTGQGGSGRGQHGAGQYGGAPTYMGH